jgi:Rieske 2Fe-2S family protein
MFDPDEVTDLLRRRQPGYSLPQAFYCDPDIYEFDLRAIFYRSWHLIGFEVELAMPGSYLATTVGQSPIVVLRNRRGDVVGFHNSCRHRGAQICKSGAGKAPRLVCPYHQWTYDLDGTLLSARGAPKDFDLASHSLGAIRVESVAGCIYAALSDDAPDFAPFRLALEPALLPQKLLDGKVVHVAELTEQANWKLVMENGRECHHCSACHPELKIVFPMEISEGSAFIEREAASPFMKRMRELGLETVGHTADWWQINRFPLKEGFVSYSMDGKPLVLKPLNNMNEGNLGTLRWAAEPTSFCHVSSDSAFMFSANAVGPLTTIVTSKWLVHKEAVDGVDYSMDRLIHLWNETNLQDRDLAENNQRGVNSIAYRPGPYSIEDEAYVHRFVDWYCARATQYLEARVRNRPVSAVGRGPASGH